MKQTKVLCAAIIMAAIMFLPEQAKSQNLEVVGQAKITDMLTDNTADQIVVRLADGTLAVRDASTLAGLPPSANTGDMLYWDGTAWVTLVVGNEGQVLSISGGIPTWGTLAGAAVLGPNDVYNPVTDKVWMDRNLGATQVATSSTDAAAYGDLYQWGRGSDGHQIRTSNTTNTLSNSDQPGHGDFILAMSPFDWRNPQNGSLWFGLNGENNPCPAGYRIPTEAEWEAERLTWSSNDAAGAFASPLKLSLAGARLGSNGSLYNVGTFGSYWSSTGSGSNSRYLDFLSSSASISTYLRANGFSVRCLKD